MTTNRFGTAVVSPFLWQPTRAGLRGLGTATSSVYSGPPVGQGAGSGALTGAAQGAAAGSVAGPIGTAIGAVAGAIGGAIAGAINKPDAEVANFDQAVALWQVNPNNVYNIANKYLVLAGLFDLNLNNPKIPIYRKYGRMGEQKFTTDLVNLIYTAAQQGKITGNDTALTIMSRIVQPWIDSWGYGPMVDPHADLIQRLIVGMIQDYVTGNQTLWRARGGDYPFGSLPAFSLPQAAATAAAPAASPTLAPPSVNPVGSATQVLMADGSIMTPGSGRTLKNTFGTWSFTSLVNPNGVDIQLALNGSASGYAIKALLANGGQIYALNSLGNWWVFGPSGWVPSSDPTAAPAPAAAVTPPATSTVLPVPSLPAVPATLTAPAIGTPVTTVPDMGQGALATQVPANLIFAGLDPTNNSWILHNTLNGQNYVVWQGAVIAYQASMFSPSGVGPVGSGSGTGTIPQVATASPSATVATTAAGAPVTQADLQALIGQLANQGQSAQQAYTSALQTLQANGIQPTAAVQSAVQQAVQTTPAPVASTATTAGLSGLGWVGVIAAGATLLFATARPVHTPKRRNRR
jgi:hypothetical protein